MSQLELKETSIPGLDLIQRQPIHDERGFFERVFCQTTLEPILRSKTIRQVNRTLSFQKGTLRGMHFQYPPHAELKLVSCVRGEVFDVAVDLRAGSSTFLQWHGEILSERNHRAMAIPEGFAHGFQSLSDRCEMLYLHTTDYLSAAEEVINALDPMLSIDWPEPISSRSERDIGQAMTLENFHGIDL